MAELCVCVVSMYVCVCVVGMYVGMCMRVWGVHVDVYEYVVYVHVCVCVGVL